MSETHMLIFSGFLFLLLLLGISWYKKLSFPYKLLLAVQLLTLISTVAQLLMTRQFRTNNLIFHIYTPLNALLFGSIYYNLLQTRKNRLFVAITMILLLAFCLADSFFIQGIRKYPHYELIGVSIVYVSYALLSNAEMIRFSKTQAVLKTAVFWLNSSILIFFSINFIFWSLFSYLLRIRLPILFDLLYILWLLNFVLYFSFTLALYFDTKEKDA